MLIKLNIEFNLKVGRNVDKAGQIDQMLGEFPFAWTKKSVKNRELQFSYGSQMNSLSRFTGCFSIREIRSTKLLAIRRVTTPKNDFQSLTVVPIDTVI